MKLCKQKFYLIVIFIIVGLLSGCNKSVVIKDLQVKSDFYQEHGYFLGNNKVKFEVDLANFNEEDLVFYWQANGGRFLNQGESKVTYLTPKLPGNYNLRLEIKEGKKTLTTFNFPFNVKGDYPEEVVLNKVVNNSFSTGVKINWSQYTNNDFYGYKVLRSNNFYIDDKAEVIASIDGKNNTSYIDYNIAPNQVYTYQIMVTNDRGYVSASNEELVKVLPPKRKKIDVDGKLSTIVLDAEAGQGYIGNLHNRELMILDLKEDVIKERLKLNILPEILVLAEEKDYLFVVGNKGSTLLRVNTKNLEIKKYDLGFQIEDLVVKQNFLYLLTNGRVNLLKFNITQGKIEGKFSITQNGKAIKGNGVEVINDQLLLVDEVFGPILIYKLTNLSTPVGKFNLGAVEDLETVNLETKHYLYVGTTKSQNIQLFQVTNNGYLNKTGEFATSFYPTEFAFDQQNKLLAAAYETKEVSIFSTQDYSLLNKLKLDNYVFNLEFAPQREKLYLLTADIDQTNYRIVVINLKDEGGNYIWHGSNN